MELKLYNTLTRKKEEFKPLKKKKVGMYTCGPTVYQYAQIGNMRAYIFADLLRRTLEYNGYEVKQVMNITDVGHLTSDADEGEDKVEKSARENKKSLEEITGKYTDQFKQDLQLLNIQEPAEWPKASEHIKEQIELIKKLEKKDFIYTTSDGVYYDTSKFKAYGQLARLNTKGQKEGARVKQNKEKRNPPDFALWKFSTKGEKRLMEWKSPWGTGFPGWHLECSAMSMKHLGESFDVHTGGIDHIPVHHTNEIAQSEGATGKQFVQFWTHNEFLTLDKEKMAKSSGKFYTLTELIDQDFSPLSYRYLNLLTHYRQPLEFSFEGLMAAQNALLNLYDRVRQMEEEPKIGCAELEQKFLDAINDDLNFPQALAVMWETVKSDYPDRAKKQTLFKMDQVLGLGLEQIASEKVDVPEEVQKLVDEREAARENNQWEKSDELRDKIAAAGFIVEDTDEGPRLKKK